jgi:hypothetical protein
VFDIAQIKIAQIKPIRVVTVSKVGVKWTIAPNDGKDKFMNGLKFLVLAAVAAICFTVTAPKTEAQVSVSIGVAPECPYGYYDAAPYDCAPYGYHVNNRLHPEHGYSGPKPARGDKPESGKRLDKVAHFKGNEQRDGRGHAVSGKHS